MKKKGELNYDKKQDKYYDVTMRVEVKRTVLAKSKEEARNKVDLSDMIYEIKYCGLDEEIFVKEVPDCLPDEYDRIDDIGKQIVKHAGNSALRRLKEQYAEIRKINEQLANAGKRTREPQAFNRLTDEFLEKLRS